MDRNLWGSGFRHGHYGFYEVKAIVKAIIGPKNGWVNGKGYFFLPKFFKSIIRSTIWPNKWPGQLSSQLCDQKNSSQLSSPLSDQNNFWCQLSSQLFGKKKIQFFSSQLLWFFGRFLFIMVEVGQLWSNMVHQRYFSLILVFFCSF